MKKVFKSKRWIAFFMALLLVVMTCIGSSDAFLRATDGGETAVSEEEGSGPAEETQYVEVEEATGENDSEDGINSEETEAENADQESNVADEEGKVQEPGESEEIENPEETDKTDMTEENADQETTEELPEEIPAVIEEEVKYGWTVSYYYDGTEDKDARVEGEGLLGEQIFDAGSAEEETVHSGKNYVLDRIENKGGEITEDAGKNVVKVYYVLKKEEAAKPAQTLKARAEDGARVTVDAPEGALPEGCKVTISVVKDSEVLKKFREAAEVDGKVLTDIKLYDVTIRDAEGREIQPDDSVTVTITNTGLEGDDASVFHADDEKAPVKKVADIDDANNASFEAEHFSVNAIAVYTVGDIKEYNIEAVLGTEIQLFDLQKEGIYDIYSGDFRWEITEGKEIVKKSDYFSKDNLGIYVLHGIAVGKATVKVSKGSEDIAIFHITVKSSDLSNPVYVYVKLDGMLGDNAELSQDTREKLAALGLSVNGHGWCTVGELKDIPIETPESGENGATEAVYGLMVTKEAEQAVSEKIKNNDITFKSELDLSRVDWSGDRSGDKFGLLVANGADDYVNGVNVWHLNGYLDVSEISYTIKYVDKATGNEIAPSETITESGTKIGTEVSVKDKIIEIPGYNYVDSDPEKETLTLGPTNNVITLYYEAQAKSVKIFKRVTNENGEDITEAKAGETIHYSIEVENTTGGEKGKSIELPGVIITDNMTGASGTISNIKGAIYNTDGTFTIDKIPAGGQGVNPWVTIEYDYTVPDTDMGKTIINTAGIGNSDITLENKSNLTTEVKIEKGILEVKAGYAETTYNGNDQKVENVFADKEVTIPNTNLKGIPVKYRDKDYYVTGVTAEATGKNAGTYQITVAGLENKKIYNEEGKDVTDGFEVKGESGTFKINKKDVTLVSASLEKEYDGTVLKNESAGEEGVKLFNIADGKKEDVTSLLDSGLLKEEGWVDGEGVDVTFTKSVRHPNEQSSNEFTYKANTGTNLDNYNIKVVFGTLAITNRLAKYEITLVTNSGNFDYDGTKHEVTGFARVLGKNTEITYDEENRATIEFKLKGTEYVITGLTAYADGITVTDYPEKSGGYPVKASGTPKVIEKVAKKDVSDQFGIDYKEGLLTINERPITVTAGSQTYKYNDTEYKAAELDKPVIISEASLVTGQEYTAEVSGSQRLVGTSETKVESIVIRDKDGKDVTGNYKIDYLPGKIEVTDGTPDDEVDDGLVVTKNADKETGYNVGEVVEFTISVTNIFDRDMTVTLDELLAGATFDEKDLDSANWFVKIVHKIRDAVSGSNQKTIEIKPGVTIQIKAFYRVTQDDILNKGFTNVVHVKLNGKEYEAKKDITTVAANGHITVTKNVASIQTAKGDTIEKPDLGDIIEYIIEVKNDGNLIMKDVVVEDKLKGVVFKDLDGGEDIGNGKVKFETLGINGHKKITAIYTVTKEDIARGSVTNVATAEGKGPNDKNPPVVDDKDAEVTTPTEEAKGYIKLIKEVSGDEKAEYAAGAVVEYEIKAFNDGNVPVKDLVVEDVLTENTKDNNPLRYDGEIAPGQTVSLGKVSYTVKETDVRNTQSKLKNIVTGEGKIEIIDPETNKVVEKPAVVIDGEKDITIEKDRPSLSITKTADKISDVQLGDKITYTITVTNNGNVTINNVVAEDALLGKTGENALIYEGTLTPGESKTFTETYVVSEKDVLAGRVKNTATVKGENSVPGGVDPEDEATVITPVKDIDVSYEVRKILLNPKEEYRVGDTVSYEIRVKNHGNVTLENVELRDALSDATGNKVTFTEINGVAPEDIDPMAPGTRVTINSDNTVTVAAIAPKEEVALRCEYIVVRADAGNSIRNKVYVKADPVKPTEVDGGPADPDKEWIYPKDKDAEADPAKVEDIYNLIIHYVYANGATAAADYAGQYLKGEMYGPIYSPNIAGYTSSTAFISSSEKGMPAEDVVLTVVYLTQTTPGGGGGGGDDTPDTPPTPPVNPDPAIPIQPEPVPAGGTGTPVVTTGGPALAALDDEAVPLGALIDVDENGNVTITPINEEQIPLAGGRNDDHKCCILHFLLMLAALIIYTWYTHSMKKHQKKLAELKDQLAEETLKKQLGITDDRQAKM